MSSRLGLRVPTPDEKDKAIQRAVKILKGSEAELTVIAVAKRANGYLPKDTLSTVGEMNSYAFSLPDEKRTALGLPPRQEGRGKYRAA